MKNPIIQYTFFYLLFLMFSSCDGNIEKPPISNMWECHHDSIWDEIKTRNALLGIWNFEFIGCYYSSIHTAYVTDRGISIEFKPDSTLIVRTKDSITQVSTWQVVDGDADLFQLEVEPFVDQLWGIILICDNRVEFNQSYADICDHWFKKKE